MNHIEDGELFLGSNEFSDSVQLQVHCELNDGLYRVERILDCMDKYSADHPHHFYLMTAQQILAKEWVHEGASCLQRIDTKYEARLEEAAQKRKARLEHWAQERKQQAEEEKRP